MNAVVSRTFRAAEWRLRDRLPAALYGPLADGTFRLRRRLAPWLPAGAFAVPYAEIGGRVHLDDQMLGHPAPERLAHYRRVGLEAVALLQRALAQAGRRPAEVRRVLDFPSGYGRVTRHLRAVFPDALFVVADVDAAAVRFCAHEFGAVGIVTGIDMARLAFPGRFDAIFVGSLLTHLNGADCIATLRVLTSSLEPGGVLVFTTHGESCLAHLEVYGDDVAVHADAFRSEVAVHGLCFRRYAGATHDWGLTVHAAAWVERLLAAAPFARELRALGFAARGWDGHQDVWSVARLGPSDAA